jgi:hypothetical protein
LLDASASASSRQLGLEGPAAAPGGTPEPDAADDDERGRGEDEGEPDEERGQDHGLAAIVAAPLPGSIDPVFGSEDMGRATKICGVVPSGGSSRIQ